MNNPKIVTQCPLCEGVLVWNPTNPVYKKSEETTHVYTCAMCPFIGFEYYSKKNTDELSAFLDPK